MTRVDFLAIRKNLNKTQKELSVLLGVSERSVQSFEQGWRSVPPHVERHLYFLLSRKKNNGSCRKPCWVIKKCPSGRRKNCPAYEFNAGTLCWFISGTLCDNPDSKKRNEKLKLCRECPVLVSLIENK